MSDKLKPCPFCGGKAKVMKMDLDDIEEGWKVWGVWCVDDLNAEDYRSHGHYIDNYATEEEAVAAWNSLNPECNEWKMKYETLEFAYKQADAERKRYSEQIDKLFAERDKLKTEIAKYGRDCGLLFDKKRKLEVERDEWKARAEMYRRQLNEMSGTCKIHTADALPVLLIFTLAGKGGTDEAFSSSRC